MADSTGNRAARRKAARGQKGAHPSLGLAALRDRVARATPPDAPAGAADRGVGDRARRLLLAWIDTAAARGAPVGDIVRLCADGTAARDIGRALLSQTPEQQGVACAAGCAFCCILDGADGGTITEAEARALHGALTPVAQRPDGRGWHPAACPALDPETRTCRAYDDRPTLCRAYLSKDAEACRINAAGGSASGAGVLGGHVDYLAVLALCRTALKGVAEVRTFALRDVAAGAVAGQAEAPALSAARHPARMLRDVRAGAVTAAAAARD